MDIDGFDNEPLPQTLVTRRLQQKLTDWKLRCYTDALKDESNISLLKTF